MELMQKLRDDITSYIYENGKEYDRLLLSKSFYERLKKEAKANNIPIDLPRLEVKENVNYDYKLLP